MSRLARKNREDIEFKNKGGLTDLFDNQMKSLHRINDYEYDYLSKIACDENENGNPMFMDLLVSEKSSFKDKRWLLTKIDKELENYYNTLGVI